jgi:ribonuclease R
LVAAHGWGRDGLSPWDIEHLSDTAKQISDTERRSMVAERDTTDRYLAAFLSERIGVEMPGRIAGVAKFGVFVKLDETGADALVPIRTLGSEYFDFDADSQTLTGSNTGIVIGLGQRVVVKLSEATPVTGGLTAELISLDERTMPRGPARGRGKPPRRKVGSSKKKAAKTERKVKRTRSS